MNKHSLGDCCPHWTTVENDDSHITKSDSRTAYLIVAGENLNSIYVENCTSSSCTSLRQMVWTSVIGAIELILAFFPGLDELKFVSMLGVFMSVGYCIIAIVMRYIHQILANQNTYFAVFVFCD